MDRKRKTLVVVALSLAVAGVARLLYANWAVTDFWGDAYHHWLIIRLTLSNSWTYTDYKGLETVWLPGYHYLISVVMAAWGRFDLAPAHLTNLVLGTLACGLVARLVTDITHDWRAGLGAGLTLALLPWHIAYSVINMPEVLAGVLLVLILLAARRPHTGWLMGLAFVGALTRHELTLLLALVAFWLGWRRQWHAMLGVVVGAAIGLGLWSIWSWYVTGEPLAWLTRYRAATAWDAHFWTEAGVRLANLATLGKTVLGAFPPAGMIGPVVVASALHRRWRRRMPVEGWLLMALVGSHWLVLGLGFVTRHLPTANPRYVLVSLPALVGAGVIAIAAVPHRRTRVALAGLHAVFLILALGHQLPTFPDKAYVIAPEKAVGEYLGTVAPVEGNFWVDAPTTIYYSQLQPERFFSSDRLLPDENEARSVNNAPRAALNAIAAHNIRFVMWEDVPYTFVQHVWPQMANGQAFEQDNYRFEPVFRYTGWELDYGARPTILWQVELIIDQK
ncbi:MAG: hypothetical protein GY832_29165 [Chloroflexi bacterium]|nr:hypothetical protein [Chloroflexota bacterium]